MVAIGLPSVRHPGGGMETALAMRPYPGQRQCGDQAGLWCLGEGRVLLALADGLGHGAAAVEAADAAMACIDTAPGLSPHLLLQRCDDALRGTRGAALSLIRLDLLAGQLEHAGVGNVSALVQCGAVKRRIASVPGIVGAGLPPVRTDALALDKAGVLAHFSDGIDPRLDLTTASDAPLAALADGLVARYGRDDDDVGLVLLRWHPGWPADLGWGAP